MILGSFLSQSVGQVLNDDCFIAFNIEDIEDFCSSGFTNEQSVPSSDPAPDCWGNGDETMDVWYSFTPRSSGLLLRFFGSGRSTNFTIDNVAIALYEGRCNALEELGCERRNDGTDDIFERIFTDIVIGRIHYIRVSSSSNDAGSFQLCLSQFNPIPEPQQDCITGVVLCDKSTFVVEQIEGAGLDNDEAAGSCLDGSSPDDPTPLGPTETSSVWYKWTAANSGSLTFTLIPNNDDTEEDLDFAIYRLPNGITDCDDKELLRCMASGAPFSEDICLGPTGLRAGETDVVEFTNCEDGSNNFLAPLDMIEGESYVLLVNNFSNSGFGFTIDFGGTAEFLGPEPDFEFISIDDFECDRTITFENLSNSQTDSIVDFQWRFGEGATPLVANGEGPHDVVYESFGDKIAVLTVESSKGCRVTKTLDLFIEPCCADMVQLELTPEVQDLTCFESGDGSIMAAATNGTPEYLFSLDDGPLLPTDIFNGLVAGDYTLTVLDVKGCEVSETFEVEQPEEIELTLSGPTDTIRLGGSGQITSDFFPTDRELIYMWMPPNGLSCTDCPDPEVTPPGTTTYTLTVTDQDGCIQNLDIEILTDNVKPFYAPNIISLSSLDPDNGIFKIFSNISAEQIEDLSIFDRWGGEMYQVENIGFDDVDFVGWDGIVQSTGRKVNPGVFIWIATVRFIDGEVRTFAGDLTVVD